MNRKNDLTVIIPFLNEGNEVENTLNSIREHSNSEIEIIVINDGSDDGFDYEIVADRYGAKYLYNETRLGVAASRDLGVSLCETPYFLIIDAHMRFYDNRWAYRIVEELKKSERIHLCCQTLVLRIKEGLFKTYKKPPYFGAFINFWDEKALYEEAWMIDKQEMDGEVVTPVVLGATYACSKKYWQYLNGLKGLKYYGSDESYISTKGEAVI